MIFEKFMASPAECTVALLGFGRSNRAVADWLQLHGATASVYADTPIPEVLRAHYGARGFRFNDAALPSTLTEQVLVRSPGMRPDHPFILGALSRGACLTSEVELLLALTPATVLGVTGSDGKTTTASLTAALLQAAGHRTWLGGNNGTPLLPAVADMTKDDLMVLELSSFQLCTLQRPLAHAVITNVTENHLNWHSDMAEYVAAKCRIFGPQTRLVLNAANVITAEIAAARMGNTCLFAREPLLGAESCVFPLGESVVLKSLTKERRFDCLSAFSLVGTHNLENLLAAVGLAAPYLSDDAPRAALADFKGVAHRLQYVDTVRGVAYYNSSIDTSPSRTAAALSALGKHPVVILGGRAKGVPFTPLTEVLRRCAKAVCLYGEAAGEIAKVLPQGLPFAIEECFDRAFLSAAAFAAAGDTVLLSPACTAFGEFLDFEARGKRFCELVTELKSERI